MKPQFLFALTFATLVSGTLVTRYAVAGGVGQAEPVCGQVLSEAQCDDVLNESVSVVRLKETCSFGEGERPALQRIAKALDKNADAPIAVVWTETYHHHVQKLRAYYIPQKQALICTSGKQGRSYVYQPISRSGIATALNEGSQAPFASANVYSTPGTSPP